MSNPLLKDEVFKSQSVERSDGAMTVSGTINKSILLWILLSVSAFYSWTHSVAIMPLLMFLLLGAFVVAMITMFKKTAASVLAPIYAILEGLVLGTISVYFEKSYPGVVVNAILLTVVVLFCMLAAYRSGILRATPAFKKVVILSTIAIFAVYLIDILLNLFGAGNFPYIHDSSFLGIVISLAVVVVASLNLIIDFDMVERGADYGAPKYMEWYCSFALMITIVWLYLEMLRLLSKMGRN
jgi:uncharacterized YccA/Bax inhibitor family protein